MYALRIISIGQDFALYKHFNYLLLFKGTSSELPIYQLSYPGGSSRQDFYYGLNNSQLGGEGGGGKWKGVWEMEGRRQLYQSSL